MSQNRYYRKHPRTHSKANSQVEEKALNLSAFAAAGILAFTLVNGMLLGYMWKRSIC